jgi:large subunit ribosomal protein L25
MSELLEVEKRKDAGKRAARRLRAAGTVPAILYGHKEPPVNLAVAADSLEVLLRRGTRVIDLTGAVKQKAFVRDLQWDTFGHHVLHVDFTRVSADERLQVEVSVHIRGSAPGVQAGGVVDQVVHSVEIECPVTDLPDRLEPNINELGLNEELTAAAIELPRGATLLTPDDTVIVTCAPPPAEEEEAEVPTGEAEPEVIGRKEEPEAEEEKE